MSFKRVKCITADGCNVNRCAFDVLDRALNNVASIICVSHSSNGIGKRFKMGGLLKNAFTFEEKWSYMIGVSSRARFLFKESCGENALKPNEQRWCNFFEIIKQIYENCLAVKNVISSEDEFA
jgi:hypothetical protein